ncbi:MAG: Dabb family protein [Dysgonamonadaceae bacterium]|jgi:hypothetical protein|nr:Dabb family protein [Dysgonamonadaceae bacterium]MDD3309201.1 Dabb family protein [Dysgonamonadaceae bacterium]MDD3900758.1 Dabb family protein [Dysgonamonadaceae bacterium]MDD4398346.1 Dabb family protein [Dysgonamonadaceae bacterium]MEA5080780.1 Dabb family protein [Dysgonamonadaceae bacterium]
MIKHLVLFKLADQAEGKSKSENALIIKKDLEALKDKVSVIKKIKVYINDYKAVSSNYDIILDSEFKSIEDVKIYVDHPDHLIVAAYIAKVRTDRAAIDYEY